LFLKELVSAKAVIVIMKEGKNKVAFLIFRSNIDRTLSIHFEMAVGNRIFLLN